ncbi:response regulator transcription factor [Paraburkholderia pallida]|uniref:Response regulator transcription factor n=1 Tax=Paraburkholderia pallida TaxID=2547399 RepID=A0A4P7D4K8_9BURK|nr:response regulator transcription factor [Paraburkholderia pallida]QBR01532.1 response regulator transcription factor [Paraburkholderia pallida]
MRILVVEDDAQIGAAMRSRLTRLGHAVDLEADGAAANSLLGVERFDLVVLDVMLPSMDGFAILRNLRAAGSTTPVLLVTARSAIDDRVSGLALGADDYLVKPFDYRELEARVQALLRRNSGHANDLVKVGGLAIDRSSRLAELDGQPLALSRQEFALLEILASRPQRIFSKDDLLNQLFSFGNEPSGNAVEQYITRVRKKLHGSSVEIRTARGMGYQIAAL